MMEHYTVGLKIAPPSNYLTRHKPTYVLVSDITLK